MIHQIAPISQTQTLPLNKDLMKVRHIQHRLKANQPDYGFLWSPATAGPYLVPVTRWIE